MYFGTLTRSAYFCRLMRSRSGARSAISRASSGLIPDNAVVVNTARGALVDDDALIGALKSGKLFAAGLDVFAGEPKINPAYRTLSNVYILPHIGSATIETRNAMGFRALDNLDAFFAGEEPPHAIA